MFPGPPANTVHPKPVADPDNLKKGDVLFRIKITKNQPLFITLSLCILGKGAREELSTPPSLNPPLKMYTECSIICLKQGYHWMPSNSLLPGLEQFIEG
jgi:hypothetical protein